MAIGRKAGDAGSRFDERSGKGRRAPAPESGRAGTICCVDRFGRRCSSHAGDRRSGRRARARTDARVADEIAAMETTVLEDREWIALQPGSALFAHGGPLQVIACDEPGAEGQHLVGGVTDVFTHAGVVLDDEQAAARVAEICRRSRSSATPVCSSSTRSSWLCIRWCTSCSASPCPRSRIRATRTCTRWPRCSSRKSPGRGVAVAGERPAHARPKTVSARSTEEA